MPFGKELQKDGPDSPCWVEAPEPGKPEVFFLHSPWMAGTAPLFLSPGAVRLPPRSHIPAKGAISPLLSARCMGRLLPPVILYSLL